ncbi:MAG: hypothetical protein Q8R83_06340 [Legionellaceae bacterium]|nr:hypothetical protein [Legionellaceae bacterium]
MVWEKLQQYENMAVVKRYAKTFNKDLEFSKEVFNQLLKWFYISRKCCIEKLPARITSDINEIDNMWHTFLLFTKDYAAFCEYYFKDFIHHTPLSEDDHIDTEKLKKELKRQLGIINQEFGIETVCSWYKERKYS